MAGVKEYKQNGWSACLNIVYSIMAENEEDFLLEEVDQTSKKTQSHDDVSYDPSAMLSFEQIKELDEKYVLPTYGRMPVAFRYGSGEFLYDAEGVEYIDFLSGIAVNNVGHSHADIIEGLNRQADLLWHTSNLFYNQQQAQLARAMIEITFPGKVFFCNSGTEANEAALKMMRAHGFAQSPKRYKIIGLKGSFHGRSIGSMSVTGQSKIQDGFGPLLPEVDFIEPNDIEGLERAITDEVAGIILEPVLGEGGVLPLTKEFLERARELCDEQGALLVFDEIQIGMGRSGYYYAYQKYGVFPDLLTTAKGLGAGFPIGAVIVADKHANILAAGQHGTTFGGNHLATAVAYEVIRLIESSKILTSVKSISQFLFTELEKLKQKYPIISEIRGVGLLIGIVMQEGTEARKLVAAALDEKLVVGRAGENVLRLAPPLILREVTAKRALERLDKLFSQM